MSEANEKVSIESVPVVTSKRLLEAGVHFGHHTKRWNPKMKPYIYTARNGIYIINLEKSAELIDEAYNKLKEIVSKGGRVLFIGTKKAAQEIIVEEALRSGSFFVINRWLGGTLTNFKTIKKSIKRLKDIEKMEESGTFDLLTKLEVLLLRKEAEKLEKNLGGIKEMRKVPEAIFVIDPLEDLTAIKEAKKLGIPVFGIVDTNSDPDLVDYVIPGNDDAVKSIKLITSLMADAIVEARGGETLIAYNELSDEDDLAGFEESINAVKSKENDDEEIEETEE